MNPSHHPQDELLLDYAIGALFGAARLVVATHLAFCDSCRRFAATLEDVGGALLEELPPQPLDPTGFERMMERLGADVDERQAPASYDPVFPRPLLACMPAGPSGLRWRPLLPGLAVAAIRSVPDRARFWLLRARSGRAVPRHGHVRREMVCVLEGGFSDEAGYYGRGCFVVFDEAVKHRVIAGPHGLLCVIAFD
jgi:putative transcriptional regulator